MNGVCASPSQEEFRKLILKNKDRNMAVGMSSHTVLLTMAWFNTGTCFIVRVRLFGEHLRDGCACEVRFSAILNQRPDL